MIWTLAIRHLLVRPGRAAVLLIGYAVGVAVMIVLLSVGDAMLDQSRDVSLVGGGELTALPHGVDVEAMRTGGLSGMFFSINGARFVTREMIGGARHAALVTAVSPVLEQKLLALRIGDSTWTVRAGGEIPSMAAAAGAALHLASGEWNDGAQDTAWRAPRAQTLYDEIDRFHMPSTRDSSWAEWHYFNVVVGDDEWWYLTLLVGGDMHGDRWGGQVLVTHRLPNGSYERFATNVAREKVSLDTTRADLVVGPAVVEQRNGSYRVRGVSGAATFDLTVVPLPHHYFPPVELGDDHASSGYAVPALVASASGRLCASGTCREIRNAPAYHDHNWGSWRAVTWEWGAGRSSTHALLYGGVLNADRATSGVPFFLALEDSLGVQQVYRFDAVERLGARNVPGMPGITAPDSLRMLAVRGDDTLRVTIRIVDVAASRSMAAGPDRVFLQMRGRWRASGRAGGLAVADSGMGFFETWVGR
ncbi:MAG: hypothetical protein ABUL71_00140 [Gemmatimonadota bacterium]